jgi:hypothetical protein
MNNYIWIWYEKQKKMKIAHVYLMTIQYILL